MLPFAGQSQTSDTICIPKKDAIKLLAKAEEGKLLVQKVDLLNDQIFLLGERIKEKEQIIAAYEQISAANDSLISNYKKEIVVLNDQKKILEQAVKDTQKEVRRYKRKLFWRTAGGTVLLGTAAYLYLTK
jgi:hypothetical protein